MDKRNALKLKLDGKRDECSFDIAVILKMKTVYFPDFPGIVGIYKNTDRECIFINKSANLEKQEQAHFHLVYHALYHQGVDFVLTEQEYIRLERSIKFSFMDFLKNNHFLCAVAKK